MCIIGTVFLTHDDNQTAINEKNKIEKKIRIHFYYRYYYNNEPAQLWLILTTDSDIWKKK